MGALQLNPPDRIIAILLSFIIATTIHEFMHAWTAWKLGDPTAERLGRITLNPAAHFEPFGFFGMVLISLGFGFIGWGKPVPFNPNYFHGGLRQRQFGIGMVALAGPVSNVVQAAVASGILRLASHNNVDLGWIGFFLAWYTWVNILLASFNMIPVPPLDGHKVLTAVLPNFWYPILAPLERYGFMILFLLVFFSGNTGASLVGGMIDPVRNLLLNHLTDGSLPAYLYRYRA